MVAAEESGIKLKWKISQQKTWQTKVKEMRPKQLVVGKAFRLYVSVNDCSSDYDLLAILRAGNQSLQECKFEHSGSLFSIALNWFHYAICESTVCQALRENMTLTVGIIKRGADQLIAQVDVLRFLKPSVS